jgi:hypothetical protein
MATVKFLTATALFNGQSKTFFAAATQLAQAAEVAVRGLLTRASRESSAPSMSPLPPVILVRLFGANDRPSWAARLDAGCATSRNRSRERRRTLKSRAWFTQTRLPDRRPRRYCPRHRSKPTQRIPSRISAPPLRCGLLRSRNLRREHQPRTFDANMARYAGYRSTFEPEGSGFFTRVTPHASVSAREPKAQSSLHSVLRRPIR